MGDAGPTRTSADLADVVELLLDKGLVVNADIAVSVGDTELLGIQIRAAVASFETAAQYGLEFPEGTDQERIESVARRGRVRSGEKGDDTQQSEIAEAAGRGAVPGPKPSRATPISGPSSDGPGSDEGSEESPVEAAAGKVEKAVGGQSGGEPASETVEHGVDDGEGERGEGESDGDETGSDENGGDR